MHVNPYLTFNGNCEEALRFYEAALGGKIVSMFTHEGAPIPGIAPGWMKKIMHARIQIGDTIVMASDSPPDRYQKPSAITINIGVEEPAEAERLFKNLAEGGAVHMPLAETFWTLRFGMLTDRFGIPWMINCEKAA